MKITKVLKWIHKTIIKYDKTIYLFMLLTAISNSISILAFSFLPKIIIGELSGDTYIQRIILYIVIFGLVIGIAKFTYTLANEYAAAKYMKIRLSIISALGKKFMNMKFSTINSEHFLDKSQKADNAINGNQQGYECILKRLTILIGNIITCILSLFIIMSLTPALIIPILIVILISRYINQKNKVFEKEMTDEMVSDQRKSDYFFDVMSDPQYGKEIRLNHFAHWLIQKLNIFLSGMVSKKSSIYDHNFKTKFLLSVLSLGKDILIYLYLVHAVINDTIHIGEFLMYISVIQAFSSAFMGVMEDFIDIKYHSMFVNDLIEFEQELDEHEDKSHLPVPDLNTLSDWKIAFDNVSFKYPNTKNYVLQHISFEIRKGEKLAIIGLNGSGKTTMVKLLTRLYDATEGTIRLNGVNIQDYSREEYYKLFAPMFQDVFMFAFSLEENITMRQAERINRNRLEESIRKIHFEQKLSKLPNHTKTSCLKILDDDGVQFSGGEEQKILLARTLYQDSPIIILDEPTASMDPISEDRLYHEFNDIIQDRAAVFITHRLASTRFCDKIYVFKKGEIVEQGSHDELISSRGEYNRLYTMQAKYYQYT